MLNLIWNLVAIFVKICVKLYRETDEAERKFSFLLLTEARSHAIGISKLKQEIKKKRLLAEEARLRTHY